MKNIFTTVRYISILLFVFFIFNYVDAQIGIDNDNPNPNSSLDLGASDRGMLPNRLTTNQRVNTLQPNLGMDEKGMWVFDTDLNLNYFWDGGQWIAMSSGSLSGSGMEGQIAQWGAGNALTGSNDLFWNAEYKRLGIGTTDPGAALHIDNDADVALKITNSGNWAISEYLVGIERTVNPISGTDLLQLKVGTVPNVDFQFLQCNYGNTPVLKINGSGHLNAWTIGAGTDDENARFNINDQNYDVLMDVKGGGTPSVLDYMVNFERTAIPYANIDMIRLKLPDGSPDNTQFMEFERGNTELVQVNGNGDVLIKNGGSFIAEASGLNTGNLELRNGGDVILKGGSFFLENNGESRATIANSTSGTYMNMYNNDMVRTVYFRSGGTSSSEGAVLSLKTYDEVETITLDANTSGGAYLNMKKTDGTSTITLDTEYAGTGKGRITCDEIRLKGGADLAEYFDIIDSENERQNLEPGTIVSIDPANPGKLIPCSKAYDHKVAGIISGANGVDPGMLMGHDNTIASGDFPVAIAGRVYVKADNSNGKIEPGDFLTTSGKTGYAMKAKSVKKAKGAIIGKAMTSLDENEGLVLVLVSLQ
jgi:hypothetical protein